MRKAFFILLLSAYSLQPTAFSQSVIRLLPWELDTARPAAQEWQLVRGETVDLECRYLSGSSAMDVRGAAVVLHARTNGMPADLSFQITGRVGRVSSTNLAAVGWVTVRVRPDLDLPHDVTRCAFALETTLDAARNLVATGTLRLSGDPTGASPAALPLFQYDALGSAQTVSNALAEAVQLVITSSVPAQIQAATAPLATTQQVAAAVAPKLSAASTRGPLLAEWVDAYYEGAATHLGIRDANTTAAVYLSPYGFGQYRPADEDVPDGVDRFLAWHDVPSRAEIDALSNSLSGVIGALGPANVGALPALSDKTLLGVDWQSDVYGTSGAEGHMRIYDRQATPANAIYLGPYGLGQFRAADAEYPDGIDQFTRWTDFATRDELPSGVVTNGQFAVSNNHPNVSARLGATTQWGVDITGDPYSADGANNGRDRAVVRIATTGSWIGSQYALYVDGYSYLSGFRVQGIGAHRNLYKTSEIGFGSETAIRFEVATESPQMRITPAGVGIGGVMAPSEALHIRGSALVETNLTVAGTNTASVFVSTAAPSFLVYSNIASSVTVTNDNERPVRIYGASATATGTVSFAALREPLPVFFEASNFAALSFSNAYVIGGGAWQTNLVNLFIAFQSGGETFVTPITAREP